MKVRLPKDEYDRMSADQFVRPSEPQPKRSRRQRRELARILNGSAASAWWQMYHRYMKSDRWKSLRLRILSQRGSVCERCGKFKNVDLHHLTYVRLGHEEDGDLKLYCRECHDLMHPRASDKRTLAQLIAARQA